MNFGFTEEQNLLRDQVERFMQDTCPMTRVREISKADGFDSAPVSYTHLTLPTSG